jgi:exosortase
MVLKLAPGTKRLKLGWVLAGWILLSVLLYLAPLRALVRLSFSSDDLSYLLLIPFLAATVLLIKRREILFQRSYDAVLGSCLLLLAGLVALLVHFSSSTSGDQLRLSGDIFSLVLFWISGFALLYGRRALKASRFPLLFLLLTIPIPDFLLGRFVYALQTGSAWITAALFDVLKVPCLREGFVFHLASVDIEVAKECSGMRSSTALLILGLLIAHFRLKSMPAKVIFVGFGLLIMIVKNGIRIVTLTLLATYVDPKFLFGRLHQQGGVVFFLLGLLLLLPILAFLKRGESWLQARQARPSASEAAA